MQVWGPEEASDRWSRHKEKKKPKEEEEEDLEQFACLKGESDKQGPRCFLFHGGHQPKSIFQLKVFDAALVSSFLSPRPPVDPCVDAAKSHDHPGTAKAID